MVCMYVFLLKRKYTRVNSSLHYHVLILEQAGGRNCRRCNNLSPSPVNCSMSRVSSAEKTVQEVFSVLAWDYSEKIYPRPDTQDKTEVADIKSYFLQTKNYICAICSQVYALTLQHQACLQSIGYSEIEQPKEQLQNLPGQRVMACMLPLRLTGRSRGLVAVASGPQERCRCLLV
jgi:hypothetical protein